MTAQSSRAVACAIVATAVVLAVTPLVFHPALPFGSDVGFHTLAARGFIRALDSGIVSPRWLDESNRGFGSPTFVFYPPLGYYVVAAFNVLTRDVLDATRWTFVAAAAASGVTFYLTARDVATPVASAAGAALYVLLPYHMLDLYERFAFGEYLAFVWFPVIVWGVRRLEGGFEWRAWFAIVLGYAALVVTHVLSAYMIVVVLVPYACVVVWRSRRWQFLAQAASAGVTALVCTAWFLLPALVERSATNTDFMVTSKFRWWGNFVLRDATPLGFDVDSIRPWVDAASVTTLILAMAAWWLSRSVRGAAAFGALTAWAFALETYASTPVWAALPGMATVQFPWRFGAFGVLGSASLVALAISARGRAAVVVGLLSVWPLVISIAVTHVHAYAFDHGEADARVGRVVFEHLPRGADETFWDEMDSSHSEAVVSGGGSVETVEWSAERRRFSIVTPSDATVVVRTLDFPGWLTRLDGQPIAHRADDVFHAIEIVVPPGEHVLDVVYGATLDRALGVALSVIGWLVVAALAMWRLRVSYRQRAEVSSLR